MTPQDSLAVTQALHEIETALSPQQPRPRPQVAPKTFQAVPREEPASPPSITDRLDRLDHVLAIIYGRLDAIEARLDAKLADLGARLG
jgi:hypothetical protein